jgi:hypothetical protein
MSEYLFGLHYYTEPRGERCGWFKCSNRESRFAVAKAVMADIDRAGGIETFRRDKRDHL